AGSFSAEVCRALGLDRRTLGAVDRARRHLAAALDRGKPRRRETSEDALLRCVLAGFPDRVIRRRPPGSPRGVMVGGGGVVLDSRSVVRDQELFVAVDLDAGPRRERSEARVRIASAVEREWLGELSPGSVRTASEIGFDAGAERIVERRRALYQDLVLDESLRHDVDPEIAGVKLAEEAKRDPARALSIDGEAEALLARVRFLTRWMPEFDWPAPDDLLARAIDSLSVGRRSFAELRAADLAAELRRSLNSRQLAALDRDAPERFRLPSGRLAEIVYERDRLPFASARIQELFGLARTPRLAAGRVAMALAILALNQRPVQVTDDLESFWQRTYPEVRKQLRGRYPKHPWPESGANAQPVRRKV
ncbi:MAG: ATP-dependent helicase C-terminal domain-containing protein, partial [Candidatus Binatia bacterium]